jgi:hypothetical protein
MEHGPGVLAEEALLRQIAEHQETYTLMYERNVLLYNELADAKAAIEHLRAENAARHP